MNRKRGLTRVFRRQLTSLAVASLGGVTVAANAAPAVEGIEAVSDQLPASQCTMAAGWFTTTKLPNGGSPLAGYISMFFKSNADGSGTNLNDVVLVIDAKFPAASYGGWFIYPAGYELPTGGVTFNNVVPDAGSINPNLVGNEILAPNRRYHVVVTSDSVKLSDLPADVRALLPANDNDAKANHITWPSKVGTDGTLLPILNRTYGQFDGYTRGGFHGPLNISWPKMTAKSLATGKNIPCGSVEVLRDALQKATPWNTQGTTGVDNDPFGFRGLGAGLIPGSPNKNPAATAPVPNPRLVEFFRVPPDWTGLPGGVVPNPDQNSPDKCSNYVVATLDETKIALIRQPLLPKYASPDVPRGATVSSDQQVGAINFQVMGLLRTIYDPGSPDSFAMGNAEIKVDSGGGATFLVWPTTLNRVQQQRVFKIARDNGWNLLAGNLASRSNYQTGMVVRQNGPAKDYYGASYPSYDSSGNLVRTGVGCYLGPQSPALTELGLTPQPYKDFNQLGSKWAMNFKTSGPYAIQGVNCASVMSLESGRCLTRLKEHIQKTGGQYNYTGPVPWVPDYAQK